MMPLRRFYPQVRAVEVVRPLTIGAAWLTTEFECLAPAHMTGRVVLAQLFKHYDMAECGWDDAEIHDLGGEDGCRRWRVTK